MSLNKSSAIEASSCDSATVAGTQVAGFRRAVTMSIPVRRILTIHPNGLENLIFTLPALRSLRESFPGARICSVVPDSLQSLMEQSRDVDDILPRRYRGISSQTALWVKLREQHFDMAICFSTSRHAALMAFASGAAVRAGFSGARLGKLLTHQVSRDAVSTADSYLELVRSLGCRICESSYRGMLDISATHLQSVDALLAEYDVGNTFVIVALEKSAFSEGAQELWKQTITELAAKMSVVIAGANAVTDTPQGPQIHDLTGRLEMPVLAALCARAQICLGNDSGLLHLSACLGIPVVAIDNSVDGRLVPVRGVPSRLLLANENIFVEQVLAAIEEVQNITY